MPKLTPELLEDLRLEQQERNSPILLYENNVNFSKYNDSETRSTCEKDSQKIAVEEVLDGIKDGSIFYDG